MFAAAMHFGPLLLLPVEGRHRPRPNGDAHDDLLLDDERAHLVRLAQPQAKPNIAEKSERRSVNGIWLIVIPGSAALRAIALNNQ